MEVGTYTLILHFIPILTIPVAICGIFCVIRIRVRAMSPIYRRLLLFYVIFSCLAELSHTLFFTPVILAPLIAGYNAGIFSFIPPIIQYSLWLGFSTGSAMIMELQFHFRFNSLLPQTSFIYLTTTGLKTLHFLFIFYMLITCIQVYFTFSDSMVIRYQLSKLYPILANELVRSNTVVISPEYSSFAYFFYYYATSSISCHGVLLICMISYSYFRLSTATSQLSENTRKTARYYLKCLIIQFCVHSTILYGPFFFMFYLQYMLQILNRGLTNICMIVCSVHGSCSILTMILVMASYRNFIIRLLFCRVKFPNIPEVKTISTRPSKITTVAV